MNSISHISNEELAAIERRCEQATAGPWESYIEGRDGLGFSTFIRTGGEDIYLTGATESDHDFIAAARQDVPKLVDEIRRLTAALKSLA